MKTITKTIVCALALLTGINAYAKREWNPACTCTFGLPAPTIKEVMHDHSTGQQFSIVMSCQCFGENYDTLKAVNDSGIVVCTTDLEAIRNRENGLVEISFEALKPGKVLLFTETHIQRAENEFSNRITIIDHYATIDMLHACQPSVPKCKNIYPNPNSNADDITFKHWFDSDADGNTFKHSNNLEKMPHCDK